MQTIRRLYRYLVAFISLEVVLWGLIELAAGRSWFNGRGGNRLTELVGFLGHLHQPKDGIILGSFGGAAPRLKAFGTCVHPCPS